MGGPWDSNKGSSVSLDVTNFDNNLSSADNTVQKAMETLDELVAGGGFSSYIEAVTANGYGTTNTTIKRFTTLNLNVGSDITYACTNALGASATINTDGIYTIDYEDSSSVSTGAFGLSLNSTHLSSGASSLSWPELMTYIEVASPNYAKLNITRPFSATDVIRPHNDPHAQANTGRAVFRVTRIA